MNRFLVINVSYINNWSQIQDTYLNIGEFKLQVQHFGLDEGAGGGFGAAGEAEQTIFQADLSVPVALVVSAEEKGMRRLTREQCDMLVKIPMNGKVDSLNVSVAAAVLMYEVVRQRS